SHSLGPTSLAGLQRALVMRSGQFLSENPIGAGRLSGPILRGGGQIHGRRALELGLCRTALRTRTLGPDQDLWRPDTAASGGTCGRLAERRVGNDARNGRDTTGHAAFPAAG